MSLFKNYFKQKYDEHYAELYNVLIHHDAKIGGELFGPVPEGHHREFFLLDEYTWVWHEEWQDTAGKWQAVTTRYDVRPTGILKSQGGAAYQKLSPEELHNFYQAVTLYRQRTSREHQQLLQAA
jgi:hypothetical protein